MKPAPCRLRGFHPDAAPIAFHDPLHQGEPQAFAGDGAGRIQALEDVPDAFPVLGAYELALKCSHMFNLLDARGAISVTERVGVMARIRTLVVGVAKAYAAQGAALQGLEKEAVAG